MLRKKPAAMMDNIFGIWPAKAGPTSKFPWRVDEAVATRLLISNKNIISDQNSA